MERKPLVIRDDGRVGQLPDGDTTPATIPELATDPSSPLVNSAWVLRQGIAQGQPLGLLLSLTSAGFKYFLSFKTIDGAVVRTELK